MADYPSVFGLIVMMWPTPHIGQCVTITCHPRTCEPPSRRSMPHRPSQSPRCATPRTPVSHSPCPATRNITTPRRCTIPQKKHNPTTGTKPEISCKPTTLMEQIHNPMLSMSPISRVSINNLYNNYCITSLPSNGKRYHILQHNIIPS